MLNQYVPQTYRVDLIFHFVIEYSLQSDFNAESARTCNTCKIDADEGCEMSIDDVDLLRLGCNAPGCGLTVSDPSFTFTLLNLPSNMPRTL